MKEKKPTVKLLIIAIIFMIIIAIFSSGCKFKETAVSETTGSTTVAETTTVQTQSTEQLSEQPDKAKFNEYFTEFYLGKLPKGTDANPSNIPVKTTVFTSEDQFCSVWTQKKDIPAGSFSIAIYDTVAKKDFAPKSAFPMALTAGGKMGSQPLTYPPGKYEYKIYIDDVLVAVLPFEVLASETITTSAETQNTEQLSEQPDKATYDEYFVEFYLAKAPKGQQIPQIHPGSPGITKTDVFISSEDEFCVTGTLKKGIPQGSFYIACYDTIAKKDFVSKTALSMDLGVGSFGWIDDPINFPVGKYEYKIYVDDVLVAVLPFEVR